MEKSHKQMLSQFPAFRFTVAHQMEAYRERIAQRIRREAANHAESPVDLASALKVHPTTVERWFRGERTPQPSKRRKLADHWEISPGELEPDPEAEARLLQEQLDRIEAVITALAEDAGIDVSEQGLSARAAARAAGANDSGASESQRRQDAS